VFQIFILVLPNSELIKKTK